MFVDDAVPGKFADAVFCIFDGHAGKLSATKCAEEFLQRICDALPEDEKRKILKKQAKERALRKQKAMEDFEKHGIPLPEEFANAAASPKAKSSKKKTSKR